MAAVQISVVVPTYQEAQGLVQLAERVHAVLSQAAESYELIIADDVSNDGTDAVCADLATRLPLRLLSRTANRGLSAAVIDGIALAQGEVVVVMDADLSHPPEKIPELVHLLQQNEADFVIGSRYTQGGDLGDDWPWWRRLNSLAATLPARWLTPIGDPMSGFFALRRADMPAADTLSPIGYKIGLELIVKGGFAPARVREVPIVFHNRQLGESKMRLREQVNYLRHLRRLYHHCWPRRMEVLQFLLIGCGGLAVDVSSYLLLQAAGVPHLWARSISYFPAVTFNWIMNRKTTFKLRPPRPKFAQWLQFTLGCGVGFALSWGTYALLTQTVAFFAALPLLALIVGVLVGTVFNFVFSDVLVFRAAKR